MDWKESKAYVSTAIVAVNVIIFLICTFTGNLLYNIGEISPQTFFGNGQYYRIVTSMFLHADIEHIANNMILLFGLGMMMEAQTGHLTFLILYFLTGMIGNAASLAYKIYMGEWAVSSLGASGAVFGMEGVLLAFVIAFPDRMRTASWQKIAIVAAYSIYCGIRSENIDNAAHIGGFVSGFLLGVIVCMIKGRSKRKPGYYSY